MLVCTPLMSRPPIPGSEKICSINTVPPIELASVEPATVSTGITALWNACLKIIEFLEIPFAFAVVIYGA